MGNVTGSAYGRAGNDTLTGGASNDELNGGSGSDALDGGSGSDTANYFDDGFDTAGASIKGVTVNLSTGKARDNWGATDTLTGIENVSGSGLDDTPQGDAGRNMLTRGQGNDTLNGGAGNDDLYRDDGMDELQGSTGEDRLDGRTGADYLKGGADAYTFAFRTGLGASNVDTIADMVSGTDHIELSKSVLRRLAWVRCRRPLSYRQWKPRLRINTSSRMPRRV